MSNILSLHPYRENLVVDRAMIDMIPSVKTIEREMATRGLIRRKAIPATAFTDLPALSRIASRLEPTLRRLFIKAVNATKNAIDLEALAVAIQSGRAVSQLEALAQIELFERRLAGYEGPIRRGFLQGAKYADTVLQQGGITISFNLMDTHAAAFAQRYTPQLVESIVKGGRENIRKIIEDAVTFGETADTAAKRIRANVGFTARDAKQYSAISAELEEANLAGEISDSVMGNKLERVANGLINRRATTIARTEVIRATNEGQLATWQEAGQEGLIDKRATKKKWVATNDELLEAICRGLDGTTVGIDDAFADGSMSPPSHPNCLTGEALVTTSYRVAATVAREYEGEVITLSVTGRKDVTITPNHPVLTPHGWVPAGEINKGDQLIYTRGCERTASRDVQNIEVPTPIKELANTLGKSGHVASRKVPIASPDLHGDLSVNANVAIINTNRLLRDSIYTVFLQCLINRLFIRRHVSGAFDAISSLPQFSLAGAFATTSLIGSKGLSTPSFGRLQPILYQLGLTAGAWLDALHFQPSTDDTTVNTITDRQLLNGHAGPIQVEKALQVRRWWYRGHVYNLESSGFYSANNLLVKNCRCAMSLVFK